MVVCGVSAIPHTDAPSQDAPYGTAVEAGLVQTVLASAGHSGRKTL